MESRILTCVMLMAVIVVVTISSGCMEKSGVEVDDVRSGARIRRSGH